MATKDDPKTRVLNLTRWLVSAADGDTMFRDLYLQHAAGELAATLPEPEYRALAGSQAQIDVLVRQTQTAVQNQDWPRVKELSAQAEGLRLSLQQKADIISVARDVYDAAAVKIDPFSPGLAGTQTGSASPVEARTTVVTALGELAKADPPWAAFYTERQRFFQGLALVEVTGLDRKPDTSTDLANLQQRARAAADRGEIAQLQTLAEQIMRVSEEAKKAEAKTPAADAAPAAPIPSGRQRVSTEPFPASALAPATALGLEHVCVKARFPELSAAVEDLIARHVWQPHANAEELAKEGAVHLRARLDVANLPADVKEPVMELAALFWLRPFLNSGGTRYFPPEPGEYVLLETFPENADPPPSELLTLLGLPKRRGLSRVEIEAALQRQGPAVLERLGLAPREFRLVCVPYDVYLRAGGERGWGEQQQWTHVDGYAITERGRLGALAAGDVRYGGLFDLVILSATDQREGVVARFCIVRRSRMQPAS